MLRAAWHRDARGHSTQRPLAYPVPSLTDHFKTFFSYFLVLFSFFPFYFYFFITAIRCHSKWLSEDPPTFSSCPILNHLSLFISGAGPLTTLLSFIFKLLFFFVPLQDTINQIPPPKQAKEKSNNNKKKIIMAMMRYLVDDGVRFR